MTARNPGRGSGGAAPALVIREFDGVPDLGRLRILPRTDGGAIIYDPDLPFGARTVGGRKYKDKEEAIAAARALLAKEAARDSDSDEG